MADGGRTRKWQRNRCRWWPAVPILGTVVALWTGGALANRPGGRTPPTTGRPSGARPARAERSSPHDVGDGLATRCADDHGGSSGSTSPRHLEVGRRALERIGYPWEERLAGWTVTFVPGRAGLLGGTWTYERRIEIYVRANQSVEDVAFTLAHEMGHAVDVT